MLVYETFHPFTFNFRCNPRFGVRNKETPQRRLFSVNVNLTAPGQVLLYQSLWAAVEPPFPHLPVLTLNRISLLCISMPSLIVRAGVVLERAVVVDTDWCFNNLS